MKNILVLVCLFFSVEFGSLSQFISSASFHRAETYNLANGPHVAFPTILRLPNDSLMIVYRRGISHVESTGRIVKRFGSPNGAAWTGEQVLVNTPSIDDRDPSITLLKDGRIMLSYYTYKAGNAVAYPPIPSIPSLHVAFSSDNGNTFLPSQCIDNNGTLTLPVGSVFVGDGYTLGDGSRFQIYATSAASIEVHDRIVIPAYGGDPVITDGVSGPILSNPYRLFFFESSDGGINWSHNSVGEDFLTQTWMAEPDLIQKSDGDYLMHYRCADDPANPMSSGPMRQALLDPALNDFKLDQDLPLVGHAPDLFRTSKGVLVSGFRLVNPGPSSQDVCFVFSIDEGVTWSDTIKVLDGTSESGYPSFTEISDNRLLISYYTSHGLKIMATIYQMDVILSDAIIPDIALPIESLANIDVHSSNFTFNIYPNPSDNLFYIDVSAKADEEVSLRILDFEGRIVIEETILLKQGQQKIPIDLHESSTGIYYVQLSGDSNSYINKIMKTN